MEALDDPDLLTLRVARTETVADGIRLIELRRPDGGELPPFDPGAHVAVQVPSGAKRNYSLCNDPNERDRYVIAVKRETEGRGGSIELIERVADGDTIQVASPKNLFALATTAPSYIFVAGGIGITPIMSMVRYLTRRGEKPFKLYYLSRNAPGTAFRAELSGPELAGKVLIHHDEGDLDNAFDLWPVFETPTRAHIYCCGPRPLMDAVRDMTGHWPTRAVHFEDFGSDLVRPRADDKPFTIKLGVERRGAERPGRDHHHGDAARAWAAGAEFLRERHLRHLQDPVARRRGGSPRSGPDAGGTPRSSDGVRLAREIRSPRARCRGGSVIRIGAAGLGRAFMLMAPTLVRHPDVRLVAAADPRAEARARFAREFSAAAHATVDELCADPNVDVVYVATPHQFHLEHVRAATARGRHVLVEKPMALTLADCRAMIEATAAAGVHMVIGHSHGFDLPYLRTRALIDGGEFGAVRTINALNFTDYLDRPRRPEELETARGGGALFSQAPHQVDVVRLLADGPASTLRAVCDARPDRRTEGAYSALLTFANGAVASLTYNGYGHFDSDELCGWIGETGQRRDPGEYGSARARLRTLSAAAEAAAKERRTYGEAGVGGTSPVAHHHFGFVVVSCERGDLRPLPDGVMVYGDAERRFEPLPPPTIPRAEVIDELIGAVEHGKPPLHSGARGLAIMEVCLAMLELSRENREIVLRYQV